MFPEGESYAMINKFLIIMRQSIFLTERRDLLATEKGDKKNLEKT